MKCKLLVAEDELIERKVLCRTLQKYLGDLICLYEAKNGREALEIFAREAPQVAVLDIEMPGLTGLEVARKIRETDRNCAILFLTGFDKFDYARQAISVRAMDYLLKPYNEQELVFAVEDAIRQVSVPLPARPAQPPAPAEPLRREARCWNAVVLSLPGGSTRTIFRRSTISPPRIVFTPSAQPSAT